jgi:hypothetical protein
MLPTSGQAVVSGMFPNGVLGSVCALDYTPFFIKAVDVIDFACDNFEPPG